MVNRILLIVLLVSFSFGLPLASEPEEELLLVYTGDVRGYVEGCG